MIRNFGLASCFALAALLSNCAGTPAQSAGAGITALRLSAREVVQVSHGGGRWRNFAQGLPEGCVPLKLHEGPGGVLYLATWDSGLFRRGPADGAWTDISGGAFSAPRIHGASDRRRKVSAFAADTVNPARLAAATKHGLLLSTDGGASWREFPLSGDFRRYHITSLAMKGGALLVGTSHAGIHRMNGGALSAISKGLPTEAYSDTLRFYEESGAIDAGGARPCLGMNISGEVYAADAPGAPWKKLAVLPGRPEISDIRERGGVVFAAAGGKVFAIDRSGNARLVASYNDIISSSKDGATGIFVRDDSGALPPLFVKTSHHFDSRAPGANALRASGKKALYANPYAAKRDLGGLIRTIESCGFNALVVDMKDDLGAVFFPTTNATARAIGACRKAVDVPAMLKKLREKRIYSIARMVVFKDRFLFRAFNGAHAIGNRATGGSWTGAPGEFWVDPHSAFVQKYVIDLAAEAAALGFDEIQFDYVRFPSDGPIGLCNYRHRKDPRIYKSEVIGDFLRQAKAAVPAPVSVDVYGITAWYRFGNRIGQDFETMAEHADALCPMVYPSHFGTKFYRNAVARGELPRYLVLESGLRARAMAGTRAVIRPYLQAFNLLSPTWGPGYISTQVAGAEAGGASGFTFWNAKGDYAMVKKALGK